MSDLNEVFPVWPFKLTFPRCQRDVEIQKSPDSARQQVAVRSVHFKQ